MGIELKPLIEDTCRQFERNFSAGDSARLVSDYYHPDVLIVAEGIGRLEGHEGAFRYFGWAIAAYYACCNNHRQIIPTAAGAIGLGSVKLAPREDARQSCLPMLFLGLYNESRAGLFCVCS